MSALLAEAESERLVDILRDKSDHIVRRQICRLFKIRGRRVCFYARFLRVSITIFLAGKLAGIKCLLKYTRYLELVAMCPEVMQDWLGYSDSPQTAIATQQPNGHYGHLCAWSGKIMPVGWDQSGAPATGQEPQVRAGRRASDAKMAEPGVWLRHLDWLDYAALGFFSALAAGFGAAFFAVPALSLAANSRLTLAVIAFMSTL